MRKYVYLFVLLGLIVQVGCFSEIASKPDLTTDTWSTSISSFDEKIDFLNTYVNCPTDVIDAEFHIFYQDNERGMVPGLSYWKMKIAVKIDRNELDLWTADMEEVAEDVIDMDWWADLPISDWDMDGTVTYYKRPNEHSYLVVYPEQGIILKYFYVL